jgi:inward rectifier potassium channel
LHPSRASSKDKPTVKKPDRSKLPVITSQGSRVGYREDLYHFFVRISWGVFLAIVTGAFIGTNIIFALLYMAIPNSVANATAFVDLFFFSVETLATIGYGVMSPQNRWAHGIVTIESLVGIASTAMITGLIFVRFARPTARILFSDKMVISKRDGTPHLTFRMANWRMNAISEAQVNVLVLLSETTKEGEMMRVPMRLNLVRDKNPMFALSWAAMHKIDETSPFAGGIDKLREKRAQIFVSMTGLDETLMQTISARWRYELDDIVSDHRFADVLVIREDGTRIIDYDRFQELIPVKDT